MSNKDQDEEYLDKLLNSIVSDEKDSTDYDDWFDDELKNIDDFDFDEADVELSELTDELGDDELSDDSFDDELSEDVLSDDVLKDDDLADNEFQKNESTIIAEDIPVDNDIDLNEEPAEFGNDSNETTDIIYDNNEIDIAEVVSQDEGEDINDLMKMLDDFEDDKEKPLKNDNIKKTDTYSPLENENEDIVSDEEENEELDSLLKEISSGSDNSDNDKDNIQSVEDDLKEKNEDRNEEKNDSDLKEESSSKKPKKKSFLSKIFSKKDKEESDLNEINAEEILSETGSALDDMSDFNPDEYSLDESSDLFADLDSIEDRTEENGKKKKEKRPKKEKEKKPKKEKEKRIKVKKEKIYTKDDFVKISPLSIVLILSIMTVIILSIYFGSGLFSYSQKINKATNYYVDKNYTEAYNAMAGMKIKSADKDFYFQVENIMKVEKHINDFNSYLQLERYAYALEALMNGIESYDENLEEARKLGTYDILGNELEEIDTLLRKYYGMSVEEARTLIQMENRAEYSKIINEKAANINITTIEGTK